MVKYIFDLDLTLYSPLDYKGEARSLKAMYDNFTPKPYLRNLLNAIKHNKYIITNGNLAHANIVLSRLELNNIFTDIVSSDMVKRLKPNPEPFDLAIRLFGINQGCEQILFFEDNIDNLETAKLKYGWTTILLTNKFNESTPKYTYPPYVDFVFRNIEEALIFFMVREHIINKQQNKKTEKWIDKLISVVS